MIAFGTPYKENSIIAIAREAAVQSLLDAFYTTVYTAKIVPTLRRLKLGQVGAGLMRELGRRAYPGIPVSKVASLASPWELALVLSRRFQLSEISSSFTFRVKHQFDAEMAKRVASSRANIVFGMWGSSECTFRLARRTGRYAVMNYVNSHPREQNRLIRYYGGAPAGHHELVPAQVIDQVEREAMLADLLLVPSEFVARQLMSRGTPASQVMVAPYGVDLQVFTPPLLGRRTNAGRRLQVLCAALVCYRKGILDLLAAARALNKEADFHLIGPLIEPALLKNLPSNVVYHGIKVQQEVVAAMQAADVLVLPSVEDSYGLVILEAMATALPVVVSDHVGASETVVDGTTGFVFPVGDVKRLVTCLEMLHADPTLREKMGLEARRYVERASPWHAYAGRVIERIRTSSGF